MTSTDTYSSGYTISTTTFDSPGFIDTGTVSTAKPMEYLMLPSGEVIHREPGESESDFLMRALSGHVKSEGKKKSEPAIQLELK